MPRLALSGPPSSAGTLATCGVPVRPSMREPLGARPCLVAGVFCVFSRSLAMATVLAPADRNSSAFALPSSSFSPAPHSLLPLLPLLSLAATA